jgi:hypothetical protein
MTYRILAKKLRKLGCELVRQAPGCHEIWWNAENKLFTTFQIAAAKIFLKVLWQLFCETLASLDKIWMRHNAILEPT